jgi:hypothetical protein
MLLVRRQRAKTRSISALDPNLVHAKYILAAAAVQLNTRLRLAAAGTSTPAPDSPGRLGRSDLPALLQAICCHLERAPVMHVPFAQWQVHRMPCHVTVHSAQCNLLTLVPTDMFEIVSPLEVSHHSTTQPLPSMYSRFQVTSYHAALEDRSWAIKGPTSEQGLLPFLSGPGLPFSGQPPSGHLVKFNFHLQEMRP